MMIATARVPRFTLLALFLATLCAGTAYAQSTQQRQKPRQPRAAQPASTPASEQVQMVTLKAELPTDAIALRTIKAPIFPPKKTPPKKSPPATGFLLVKIDAPPGTKQEKWLPGDFSVLLEDAATGGHKIKGYLLIGRNEWEFWHRQRSAFVVKTYSEPIQAVKYKAKLTVIGQYQLSSEFQKCWQDDETTFDITGGKQDAVTFQLKPVKKPSDKCVYPKGVE